MSYKVIGFACSRQTGLLNLHDLLFQKKPFKQKAGFCPGLKEKIAFQLTKLAGVCDQLVAMITQPVTGYKRERLAQRKPFVFLSLSLFYFFFFFLIPLFIYLVSFLYRILVQENHTRTWWKENFSWKGKTLLSGNQNICCFIHELFFSSSLF